MTAMLLLFVQVFFNCGVPPVWTAAGKHMYVDMTVHDALRCVTKKMCIWLACGGQWCCSVGWPGFCHSATVMKFASRPAVAGDRRLQCWSMLRCGWVWVAATI
jgi:hypothetical protein